MKKILFLYLSLIFVVVKAKTINIIAAENFYGKLAAEIGGNNVTVTNIISNPNADPHLFSTTPRLNQQLTDAAIIIYNGAGYDDWMDQLLNVLNYKAVSIINVAKLLQVNSGANPHLWYNPITFPKLAQQINKILSKIDKANASYYQKNLSKFLLKNQQVQDLIAKLKPKLTGNKVIATEPVFNYMATALGLNMQDIDFQWKIMNDSEPSPKMIMQFQDLILRKQVKVLFYNKQISNNLTNNLKDLALKHNISIVGISETMPQNLDPNSWLLNSLSLTANALK